MKQLTDAEKWQAVAVLLDHTEKLRDGMTIHGFYQAVRVLVHQPINREPDMEMSPEAEKLYRGLNGLDLPPRERAEFFFSAFADGVTLGPHNRNGIIDALTRYFEDFES